MPVVVLMAAVAIASVTAAWLHSNPRRQAHKDAYFATATVEIASPDSPRSRQLLKEFTFPNGASPDSLKKRRIAVASFFWRSKETGCPQVLAIHDPGNWTFVAAAGNIGPAVSDAKWQAIRAQHREIDMSYMPVAITDTAGGDTSVLYSLGPLADGSTDPMRMLVIDQCNIKAATTMQIIDMTSS